MAKREYVAFKFRTAVKPGSAAERDILAIRDKEKRARAAARKAAAKPKPAPKPTTGTPTLDKMMARRPSIRSLQQRIVRMRLRAMEVERSKTGNKKAAATYRRVADELAKRLKAFKKPGK